MLSGACRLARRHLSAKSPDPQDKFGAMNVFDRRAKQRHRELWVTNPEADKYDYLREEIGYRMADRLLDIKRKFDTVVELGCGRGYILQHILDDIVNEYVLCDMSEKIVAAARGNDRLKVSRRVVDEEQPLPFAGNSLDAVISSLSLHWVNNLPGLFCSVADVLKPDGAFMGSMFGNDTLYELRGSLQVAETELEGGFGIHVSPFVEPADLGGLLRAAGFSMLTLDSDSIVVGYPGMPELMADLKGMAENNCAWKRKTHLHRRTQLLAGQKYKQMYGDEKGTIRATFHILSFIAWKPHESQQKPAKRGSATVSLKDLDKFGEVPPKS
ncbi:putative methyltransferase C20orf7 -like protein [Tropilaelaps mercedesae]|uniref:Arginine-hydroxylase NDUFAF5, mitochondrial n=1 Tax=Tropilaelaps mercedesae TaxID=418985 RepID=A0A1V9XXA1_9ACAR|nr:putative methyltransferase C20orf7 -like protein [Tropilaelaps mercedesae]